MRIKKILTDGMLSATTLLLSAPAAFAQSGPSDFSATGVTQAGSVTIASIINLIGGWMLAIAGALGVLYLIYGGLVYITGGAEGASAGKTIIINAIIGLIIVALSFAIANFVITQVGSLG